MINVEEVGKRLQKIREEKKFKITEFASLLGYSGVGAYSNIEKGKAKAVSINIINKAADVLNVSATEILGIEDKAEQIKLLKEELRLQRLEKDSVGYKYKFLIEKLYSDYLVIVDDITSVSFFIRAYKEVEAINNEFDAQEIAEINVIMQDRLQLLRYYLEEVLNEETFKPKNLKLELERIDPLIILKPSFEFKDEKQYIDVISKNPEKYLINVPDIGRDEFRKLYTKKIAEGRDVYQKYMNQKKQSLTT